MIKKITEGSVVTTFFYDADGKRIKKTQGASSILYFGKDLEIINNTPTLYAFAGNLRIAKITAAGTEYYHKDHQGSTNAITTDTGTILDTAEYLPYGPDRSVNALLNRSAYKYTDQEQDAGTGLYNYDARLYDPVLGQFVMADTIVPEPFNPQSLNRYAYCLNNPIRYVDPDGHTFDSWGGFSRGGLGGSYGDNNGLSSFDPADKSPMDGWQGTFKMSPEKQAPNSADCCLRAAQAAAEEQARQKLTHEQIQQARKALVKSGAIDPDGSVNNWDAGVAKGINPKTNREHCQTVDKDMNVTSDPGYKTPVNMTGKQYRGIKFE